MGMLDTQADRIGRGETVEFRPTGGSMVPLVHSRQKVRVAPADPALVEVGDIVLARVAGTVYLHLVSAVDVPRRRVQISNNHGRVNGWTGHDRVLGICLAVDDVPRPGAAAKVRRPPVRPVALATARLELLPLLPEHADEMSLVLADPALHAFTGGVPLSPDALRDRCERLAAGSPTRRSSGPTGCCGCAGRGGWWAPSRPRSPRRTASPSWPGSSVSPGRAGASPRRPPARSRPGWSGSPSTVSSPTSIRTTPRRRRSRGPADSALPDSARTARSAGSPPAPGPALTRSGRRGRSPFRRGRGAVRAGRAPRPPCPGAGGRRRRRPPTPRRG